MRGLLVSVVVFAAASGAGASESRVVESLGGDSDGGARAYNISAGFGPSVLNGALGWGFNVSAVRKINFTPRSHPFRLGLDVGMQFWRRTNQADPLGVVPRPEFTGGVTNIQVLPTAYWEFLLPMVPAAIPYLGLSAGPSFYLTSGTAVSGGAVNESELFPTLLLRPGLHVVLSEDAGITFEPKLGFLESQFLFVPNMSAVWHL